MPSSPRTPPRRRQSSIQSIDLSLTSPSPKSAGHASRTSSFSRRSSQCSMHTPTTPRPLSSRDRNGDFSGVNETAQHRRTDDNGKGLGSLADELAEAWDGEDEEDNILRSDGPILNENIPPTSLIGGVHLPSSPAIDNISNISFTPPKISYRSKHRRQNSQYDGSDYGADDDFETADGISPFLESRMATIESLARRGTEANSSIADSFTRRVASLLKDLPSQSGVENGTSRLMITHRALTSHLTNQARILQALTHALISPHALPPDRTVVDDLIPLLATLLVSLPAPTAHCLSSLHSLRAATSDMQSTLTYLSDTIYMTRQTTTFAARKLRAALDMVVEMRRETEAREEAVKWIEKGGWDRRLGERECKRVCEDVIGGFEEVCQTWRERLVTGVGAA